MNTLTSSASACALEGKVYLPDSDAYTTSLGSYFALQQSEIHPSCIASPASANDVSIALDVLTNNATQNAICPFSVRSGGHATFIGASNINGGVTIDLRGLDSISLNPDDSTVSVGVGATWGSVYSYLDPMNQSVVGAGAYSVGVGGVTIGGGISYFGPRYGWTCDTVVKFEVVLADGSIVNASEDENADLFWALRGGASNFGIVTRVDMEAFDQGNLWGGALTHEISVSDQEIDAIVKFSSTADYDEYASLIGTFAYTEDGPFIVNSIEYTRDEANPTAFQGFLQLPFLSSTLRSTNMTDLATETDRFQMRGQRVAYATVTINPVKEAIGAIVDAWNSSLNSVQSIDNIGWNMSLEPLPPALYARHAKNNALGLSERHGEALMVILFSATWASVDDDADVKNAMQALAKVIEEEAMKVDALDPYLYANYAAAWQDPINSYGRESIDGLRRVRSKYDSRKIFTNHVPGGFKIPN